MRLHSWLTKLARAFALSNCRPRVRHSRKPKFVESALVERLEPRRLLSAAPVGIETRANTFTAGDQARSDTAIDAAGDSVVSWMSKVEDGSGYGIYAQRYNASGAAQGTEFRVNTFTTSDQVFPSVAMDAAGDFAIAWRSLGQDGSGYGIYAQRYNAAGVAQGAEFRVNTWTTFNQDSPSVSMDSAGDFVITWQSYGQDGDNYGIYAQRYNAAGAAQGSEFSVNSYTTSVQRNPSVALDTVGDFVITWSSYLEDGSGSGIYAQRYDKTGSTQGSHFRVNSTTGDFQGFPAVAMDGAKDFVITWQSEGQDGSGYGIYAQRYNAAGTPQGAEFRVNSFASDNQTNAAVALDAGGDFVISWRSPLEDGDNDGIYAQSFSAAGVAQGTEFRVNTLTTGSQSLPSVAMNAKGDFVLTWSSVGQDGSGSGIYVQRYATTVGPIVINVLEGTGPRVVKNGDKLLSSITMLTVQFSELLNTTFGSANSVLNPSNWILSRNLADVSDLISGITFSFDTSSNRWIATVSFVQPLASGAYSIVARQTIQNYTGQSLDGEVDGLPGGDFRRNFSVATTLPAGGETRVNTYTTANQSNSSVATDAAGDFVVTWVSETQNASFNGIYAQRYNAAGTPLGAEFIVNTNATFIQQSPSVAMDAAGDFVIAWANNLDLSGNGIFAQRYNATGVAQGNEFRVNTFTTSDQSQPSVAMDAAGDFVISWQSDSQDGSAIGVYAQRYNAAGVAQGNEFRVNTFTTNSQENPSVAMDAVGEFVIAWESSGQDGHHYGVFAQRYNAAGVAQGVEFQVNTVTANDQESPSVAMDNAGDFVITWSNYQAGFVLGSSAQRYNAAGTAQGGEFNVTTSGIEQPTATTVAMDVAGDFVITWASKAQDGSGFAINAQRYNMAGVAQGTELRVNTYTTGNQFRPSVAMDAAGDFVITWQSDLQDGDGFGIYAQRYRADVAPVVYLIEGTPLSAVASLTTPITSSLLAVDQDSNTWTGATIQINVNYRSDQDVLGFVNTANITGSWNAATGTLTLTGTDTVSNYRTALRNVTYHNTSASPNTALTRTISFRSTDGLLSSNTVSRDVNVLATSVPAVLSGVSGTGTYSENAPTLALAANLVIADPDSVNLASATVSFTGWQSEDRLDFNNIFAMQHALVQDFVAHTATFTITGISTVDHYQTLLRSIVYWDISDAPNTTTRVASFKVNDGLSNSNVVVRSTVVSSVNDAPVLSAIEATPLAYKANDPAFPPLAISSTLLVSEPDSNNLTKATVQITAGYQNDANGHDVLAFTNQLGITGSFNAATGTLTLSGTSGVGNYRTALRSVKFSTSGALVSTANRTLTIIGTDDFSPTPATGLAITRIVSVSLTNNPPALTGIPSTAMAYVRGTAALAVAPNTLVLDTDSINLTGATVQVTGNYQNGQDVLAATGGSGIAVSFNPATGTLTLSGLSSLANYQNVLRTVTYKTNTALASTSIRTISFLVNDGLSPSSAVTRSVTLT